MNSERRFHQRDRAAFGGYTPTLYGHPVLSFPRVRARRPWDRCRAPPRGARPRVVGTRHTARRNRRLTRSHPWAAHNASTKAATRRTLVGVLPYTWPSFAKTARGRWYILASIARFGRRTPMPGFFTRYSGPSETGHSRCTPGGLRMTPMVLLLGLPRPSSERFGRNP